MKDQIILVTTQEFNAILNHQVTNFNNLDYSLALAFICQKGGQNQYRK